MNHTHFEELILDDIKLSPEQKKSLEAHLAECTQCQKIQTGWSGLRQEMRTAPPVNPAPGFTQRWKANSEVRRAQQQMIQSRKLIIGFSISGFVLLAILSIVFFTQFSPADLLVTIFRTITRLAIGFEELRQVVTIWFKIVISTSPATLAIFISTWFVILSLGLFISYTRFWRKGEVRS
jgi:hypothetical protein